MEGVIPYRLLGDHPAASGRYLMLGFPGETTTRDKIIEQVIQEHRINTSRYKLEVRRLVDARDAQGHQHGSPSPPPQAGGGSGDGGAGTEDGGLAGLSRDAKVAVVLHANEELHTYDRLTIHVSQRQLADDDASRKEQEQLERQRRVREMEAELLIATSPALPHDAGAIRRGTPPPPSSRSPPPLESAPQTGRVAAVDALRLPRAAALASQLFPILKGQHGGLASLDDPANTHNCVLCRLPAFAEMLTSCCHFSVCISCYASAAEMDMEEGRCPVCGAKHTLMQRGSADGDAAEATEASARGGSHKRAREDGGNARGGWKREGADDSKDALQRNLELGEGRRDGGRGTSSSSSTAQANRADAPAASGASSAAVSKESMQVEERLRHDVEKAFAFLDGPDMLSATVKEKRVVSAELTALSEL